MDITLAGGGIETRIIYEFKRPIGDFEAYKLLGDEAGRDVLRRIYQSYAEVAVRYGLPIQLGTPTWRASHKWTKDVASVNAAAVELLCTVKQQFAGVRIIIAGVIGPASDGYATDEALSADAALHTIATKPMSLQDSMSIFSTRQPFQPFQNCLASPAPWRKPAARMHWHLCCTQTARCSMGRHWQT
jgi:hypothetical protein